jgi:putative transposase
MSTYTQLLYHIVFSTYQRTPSLSENGRSELFAFIYGLLKNKNCHLYRINGIEDHLHIFTHTTPDHSSFIVDQGYQTGQFRYDNEV